MSDLRDADGTIVINEEQAEEDVHRIQIARARLEEAKRYLNPNAIDSGRMYGAAHDALEEQLGRINRALSDWQEHCDSYIRYIRAVVAEYQRIDKEFAAKAKEMK